MAKVEKDYEMKSKKTDYIELFLKDGILHCIYNDIEQLDIDIAQTCVRDRLDFAAGTSYPSLFDITRIKHSTKEARDHLANEGNEGVLASAILVGSPMLKMAANFFIKVNKPYNPSRMFTNQQEALSWLHQFKPKVL
ncbi:DUF7793 family protein [Pontibacter sp. HJ8]